MANLQATCITGTFTLGTTCCTAAGGWMWYNPTNCAVEFSYCGTSLGAWSVGAPGPYTFPFGAGTQNAGLGTNGYTSAEYNGSTWASAVSLRQGRGDGGSNGTQNAGLYSGGFGEDAYGYPIFYRCTEEYNGSSWAYGGALPTEAWYYDGAGTQNAALLSGGASSFEVNSFNTWEYNGSSWTQVSTAPAQRYCAPLTGTQNAALLGSGRNPTQSRDRCTDEYNGSSWATAASGLTVRCTGAMSGGQNSALKLAGIGASADCVNIKTEEYNGTSWDFSVSLPAAVSGRQGISSDDSTINAIGVWTRCPLEFSRSLGIQVCSNPCVVS